VKEENYPVEKQWRSEVGDGGRKAAKAWNWTKSIHRRSSSQPSTCSL